MMKKLVIVNPKLTEQMREQIVALAEPEGFEVAFYESNADALPAMEDAQAAYGMGADLTRAGQNLEWFHSITDGIDAYLQEGAIANPEMILTNARGAFGVTLAEHTIMVTLEILRRHPEYAKYVARKEWKNGLPQRGIKNSIVTILGTGDLGSEIAKRIAAFDPQEIIGVNRSGKTDCRFFDRVVKQNKVDEVLGQTDILIMCLPGTPETCHFIDARRIALLPGHAAVVNVGRGNAIDTRALADALREGKLWAAALDVFEKEPLDPEDPLWDCPDLLITPHIAGFLTLDYTLEKNFEIFLGNLKNYLDGKPLNQVIDRNRGY